jgi:hypothetical protein
MRVPNVNGETHNLGIEAFRGGRNRDRTKLGCAAARLWRRRTGLSACFSPTSFCTKASCDVAGPGPGSPR